MHGRCVVYQVSWVSRHSGHSDAPRTFAEWRFCLIVDLCGAGGSNGFEFLVDVVQQILDAYHVLTLVGEVVFVQDVVWIFVGQNIAVQKMRVLPCK